MSHLIQPANPIEGDRVPHRVPELEEHTCSENYCHSVGNIVVFVVHRQKF